MKRQTFFSVRVALSIIAASTCVVTSANGACPTCIHFWLSASDQSSPVGGNPNISHVLSNTSQDIFLWARPAPTSETSPPAPLDVSNADELKVLQNFSLNLRSTNPGVISLVSVDVFNNVSHMFGGADAYRFEEISDSSIPEVDGGVVPDSDRIADFQGFTIYYVDSQHLGLGNVPFPYVDQRFDDTNVSWLVAKISYTIGPDVGLSAGKTELFLEIGQNGINHVGETAANADIVFGDLSDPPINGAVENRGAFDVHPLTREQTPDATVSVFESLPGDYSMNGVVDAADYVVWRLHLNQAFQLPNEVPGVTEGQVTIHDYNEWKMRFGATSGSGTLSGTLSVPEPTNCILGYLCLVLAGTTSVAWRRRR